MDNLLTIILSLGVTLCSAYLCYQYTVHHAEDGFGIRKLFAPKLVKMPLIVAIVSWLLSVCVYLYCALRGGDTFFRAIMNAEVFLWLAFLGYIDVQERIIPNVMIGVGLVSWLALVLIDIFAGGTPAGDLLMFSLAGGLISGGVLLIISLISKSALGMGDVKMFTVLGLLYGLTDTYSVLLFSVVIMAVVSIVLLLAKKATRKTAIPMAPFVAIGFLLCILAGM